MKKILFFAFSLSSFLTQAQNVGIGTATPNSSAALDITSTTGSLLIPRLNNTQIGALTPVPGMMVYNTDANKFQGYAITSGGSSSDQSQKTFNTLVGNNPWQSFTAGVTGNLTNIRIHTQNANATTLYIYSGTGTTGTLLYTQSLTTVAGGSSGVWLTGVTDITLSTPLAVVSGTVYSIAFANGISWHIQYSGNPYAGGISSEGSDKDFSFETYVASSTAGWVNLH